LALTAAGVVLGATVALGLTRLLGSLLYKVSRAIRWRRSAFVVMAIARWQRVFCRWRARAPIRLGVAGLILSIRI